MVPGSKAKLHVKFLRQPTPHLDEVSPLFKGECGRLKELRDLTHNHTANRA